MTPNDQITELLKFTISLLSEQRETAINERDEARAKLEIAVGALKECSKCSALSQYSLESPVYLALEALKKIQGET